MRYLVLIATLFIVLVSPVWADDGLSVTTVLHRDALSSGYTVVNPAGTAALGIPGNAVKQTAKVRVKLSKVAHPEDYYGDEQPISDLYRFSLHNQSTFKLKKKLWLRLSYPSAYADRDKVIKYYDSATDRWRKLTAFNDNTTTYNVTGHLKKKHGIIAAFEKPSDENIVQGMASWYDWTGAACNAFPLGSQIRVTNVATGAYVDTTVVSTGPFIPGRVVDLTRADFAAIADISAGVVEVTVQQLD
ncbi:MAG: hypothetical protein HY565_04245 [Candidatus Kerfeldbacteria bacterium]|nr:hypothetical protein [Candidatus Kerfeldbacteria bacterium]